VSDPISRDECDITGLLAHVAAREIASYDVDRDPSRSRSSQRSTNASPSPRARTRRHGVGGRGTRTPR